jgi:glycosyltransferase involved in cell wall biosynthesis
MHIGIVGPCSSGLLKDFLPESNGIDLGWGGGSVAELVRGLLQRGHRVSVITLSPKVTERMIVTGPSLDFYVYPMRTQRRMRDLYEAERKSLREGIRMTRPDILHAHWTYEFALACLEENLPTLITCRDNAFQVLFYRTDFYRLGRLFLQLWVLRKARFLTAVSPYLAKSLRYFSKGRIEVIANPINLPDSTFNANRPCSGRLRIATVLNGWGSLKNPKPGIRAFNLFRRMMPEAEMFMYGADFQETGPAAQWAAKKNIAQNIHFCGPLPRTRLLQELQRMSILLHPALEESFGMAILEAMALRIPVVAGYNCGAVPWVLDDGRAGFLTNVRNPQAIAETLLTCVTQPEDRVRRQQNAYTRACNQFSSESISAQYENVYGKVLASW